MAEQTDLPDGAYQPDNDMTRHHKVTIRLDACEADTLRRISEVLGASQTATVQALIATAGERFKKNNWAHPTEWTPEDRKYPIMWADKATKIDAMRRRRN